MSTEDDARSGRPKEAITDENIKKVDKIIVMLIESAKALQISEERVRHILRENLGVRKLCSKWVPRELTIDQKQKRVDNSEQCLKFFLHYFTPKSEQSSSEWTANGEPTSKHVKTQQSAGKESKE